MEIWQHTARLPSIMPANKHGSQSSACAAARVCCQSLRAQQSMLAAACHLQGPSLAASTAAEHSLFAWTTLPACKCCCLAISGFPLEGAASVLGPRLLVPQALDCRPCLHDCLRRPAALNFALARGPNHKAKTKSALRRAIPAAPLPNVLHMVDMAAAW